MLEIGVGRNEGKEKIHQYRIEKPRKSMPTHRILLLRLLENKPIPFLDKDEIGERTLDESPSRSGIIFEVPLLDDKVSVSVESSPMAIFVSKATLPSAPIEAFTPCPSNNATTEFAVVSRCIVLSSIDPYKTRKETVPEENLPSPGLVAAAVGLAGVVVCCWNSPKPL